VVGTSLVVEDLLGIYRLFNFGRLERERRIGRSQAGNLVAFYCVTYGVTLLLRYVLGVNRKIRSYGQKCYDFRPYRVSYAHGS
jgi:hypothetical protein